MKLENNTCKRIQKAVQQWSAPACPYLHDLLLYPSFISSTPSLSLHVTLHISANQKKSEGVKSESKEEEEGEEQVKLNSFSPSSKHSHEGHNSILPSGSLKLLILFKRSNNFLFFSPSLDLLFALYFYLVLLRSAWTLRSNNQYDELYLGVELADSFCVQFETMLTKYYITDIWHKDHPSPPKAALFIPKTCTQSKLVIELFCNKIQPSFYYAVSAQSTVYPNFMSGE